MNQELITIKEASEWISIQLKKDITPSNISYLVNYGRIKKFSDNGNTLVSKKELIRYYDSYYGNRQINWKEKLGNDIDWHLSFEQYKEFQTTKHVHRLHPYKGKFIPQLVEYFLDDHTDEFKKEVYFNKGDIVLDPFCGSGTTLVQANELGMNCLGVDISSFNSLMSNAKIGKYNLFELKIEIQKITEELRQFIYDSKTVKFEKELLDKLSKFNNEYFPSPEYKLRINNDEIDEKEYGKAKENEFLPIYKKLVKEFEIELKQGKSDTFLDKWFLQQVRSEIEFVFDLIKKNKDPGNKKNCIYHSQSYYSFLSRNNSF